MNSRRWVAGALMASALAFPMGLYAQEGVFDMGVLGMNGAIDHATQQAEEQAGIRNPARESTPKTTLSPAARTRACAKARQMTGKAGADPRLPRLVYLCSRLGY